MTQLLLKGGTIIDGTGAPGFRADVRVRGGRITEVGGNLRPNGEKVIDAGGAFVTPGFIDCHTHYDGPMWWMPTLDPMPGYGTTTVVMGNCGLSAAPMSADMTDRKGMIGIFSFLEDIPRSTFENELPWNWQSWSEYSSALKTRPATANVCVFIGHLNLRIAVMGEAAWERKANAVERAKMAALLDDGLRNGAMGLSTNFFDNDPDNRPVPSRLADDEEFEALLDVMARYPGVIMQFITNLLKQSGIVDELKHMTKLCQPRGIRMQFSAVPAESCEKTNRLAIMDYVEEATRKGADIWAIYGARPLDVTLNFERSLVFNLAGAYAWDELTNKTPQDQKLAKLKDPAWRARARHEWDNLKEGAVLDKIPHYLSNSENGAGPIGLSIDEYAKELGIHKSDALAEWLIRNGVNSTVRQPGREIDEEAVLGLLRHPTMVSGADDAGAHGQLFCGAGEPASLLTRYVRTGHMSVEEMVHALTGKLANHFSLTDRGIIAPGKIADLTVFALDEIEWRPEIRVQDVPDGNGGLSWRYTRPAAPMRATIVKGVPTFEAGQYSGELPGTLVGPGAAHAVVDAAE